VAWPNPPLGCSAMDAETPAGLHGVDGVVELDELRRLSHEFTRFSMVYKFAIDEITTKINILREEFSHLHDYNPIEHVNARLKSPESILQKAKRRGSELTFDDIREHVRDIAGVRVTCSFLSDVYTIFHMLTGQSDVTVVDVDDYIAAPKPNGYQSLHATVQVPVFLSDGPENVYVELQVRTVAMDFWASLEHKIYYKYDRAVPARLLEELKEAADTAARLDERMEKLHRQMQALGQRPGFDGRSVAEAGAVG
jgi:putative GTP pyrophosphokinase